MGDEFYIFLVWFLVVIVVFFLARNYGVSWWSSLVLALFVGLLLLVASGANSFLNLGCDDEESSSHHKRKHDEFDGRWLLGLLGLISVVVVIVFIVQKVFEDRHDVCEDGESSE